MYHPHTLRNQDYNQVQIPLSMKMILLHENQSLLLQIVKHKIKDSKAQNPFKHLNGFSGLIQAYAIGQFCCLSLQLPSAQYT